MFPFINVEFPLSGDVTQAISPSIWGGFKGVPEVELKVFAEVASPGAQLDKLTEAVLLLADQAGLKDAREIKALQEIADGVKRVKAEVAQDVRARADETAAHADRLERIARGGDAQS